MITVVIRRQPRDRVLVAPAPTITPRVEVDKPRRVETRDQRIAREVRREFQEARTRII